MLNRILVGLIFAVVMAGAAVAGPYEDGIAAYNRGSFDTAVKLWTPLAEQGDADAQNAIGVMYYFGQSVSQDYAEAAKWYRRAAEQGLAFAQGNLGAMYAKGYGVPQNFVLAYMWLDLAAADGNEDAATYRDFVSDQMTPDQLAEAQRLARE
jgi:TPR repeat protein